MLAFPGISCSMSLRLLGAAGSRMKYESEAAEFGILHVRLSMALVGFGPQLVLFADAQILSRAEHLTRCGLARSLHGGRLRRNLPNAASRRATKRRSAKDDGPL